MCDFYYIPGTSNAVCFYIPLDHIIISDNVLFCFLTAVELIKKAGRSNIKIEFVSLFIHVGGFTIIQSTFRTHSMLSILVII